MAVDGAEDGMRQTQPSSRPAPSQPPRATQGLTNLPALLKAQGKVLIFPGTLIHTAFQPAFAFKASRSALEMQAAFSKGFSGITPLEGVFGLQL